MFIASKVVPWLEPPSPVNDTATVPRAERLGGQRRADHQRRAAADDAVGAEHALVEIGDVHRAALAAAQPGLLGEQLLHHPGRVAALGDAVAVPAMGAGDVVLRPEMRADADRGGLLAGIEMDKAGNAALRELLLHPLLEAADRRHVAIGLEQFLAAQLHRSLPQQIFLSMAGRPSTAKWQA